MTSLLEIQDLNVDFAMESRLSAWLHRRSVSQLRAVDGVNMRIGEGEAVGIVGESGSGKSTLARVIVGLVSPSQGEIVYDGNALRAERGRTLSREIQMVFQDAGASLNPSISVRRALAEPVRFHGLASKHNIEKRCRELLDLVELPSTLLDVRPGSLSGGQRQRVGIARALALEPRLLIADEAVSALDVSVRAPILNLLNRLRRDLGLTLLFISHDLAVVRHVTDRTAVLYLGSIVEDRPTEKLFDDPQHPYTQALIAAAPKFDSGKKPGDSTLSGEIPSPLNRPSGCRFRTRCPAAEKYCSQVEPDLVECDHGQRVACHFAWIPSRTSSI